MYSIRSRDITHSIALFKKKFDFKNRRGMFYKNLKSL
jgi:hypothetical protein